MHSAIQETVDWKQLFDGRLDKPLSFKQLESLVNSIKNKGT
jgi:hypothetical protein